MECARQPMLTSRRIRSELSGWIWMHHVPVSVLRAGGGAWCVVHGVVAVAVALAGVCFHVCFLDVFPCVFLRFWSLSQAFPFPSSDDITGPCFFRFFFPFYSFWSLERLFRFPLFSRPALFLFLSPLFPSALSGSLVDSLLRPAPG